MNAAVELSPELEAIAARARALGLKVRPMRGADGHVTAHVTSADFTGDAFSWFLIYSAAGVYLGAGDTNPEGFVAAAARALEVHHILTGAVMRSFAGMVQS